MCFIDKCLTKVGVVIFGVDVDKDKYKLILHEIGGICKRTI